MSTHWVYFPTHGLINYIDTKAKCRNLKKNWPVKRTLRQVFIRVYRLEIQSDTLIFSTRLCELLPLEPFLWFNSSPLLPCVKVQFYRQCVAGGVESCWRPCIWPDSEPTKLLDHPKQKPRGGEEGSDRQTPAAKSLYVRHVTGNDQDYLRKIPRVVVQKSALL
jgi:hypothetical protein